MENQYDAYYNQTAETSAQPGNAPKRVTFWQYMLTREFWSIIGGALLVGALLVLATFYIAFPLITKHNETRETPDVTSHPARNKYVSLQEATRMLKDQGFAPVVSDSVYYPHMKPLAVVRQEPVPLTLVKPGRNVYLVVNKAAPPDVKLPDVKDLQLPQAKNLLLNWKLKVGKIEYMPGDHPGIVMKARYKGEDLPRFASVPEGAAIDLVVSQGVGDLRVPYPPVEGLTMQEALEKLKMAGLNPVPRFTGRDPLDEFIVLAQSPKAKGDSIRYGATVRLSISGEEPDNIDVAAPPPANELDYGGEDEAPDSDGDSRPADGGNEVGEPANEDELFYGGED